ncbi:hypothetical protein [Pseudomonas extremaustralis]
MALITKNEYKAKYDYVMCNLISRHSIKPVKVIGRFGYYDEDELNKIRDLHISQYIDCLKDKGFKGVAYKKTEKNLIASNGRLSYKQHFCKLKEIEDGVSFQTAVNRLNDGIAMIGIEPVGFTYNGKHIYLLSDFLRAYNFSIKVKSKTKTKKSNTKHSR